MHRKRISQTFGYLPTIDFICSEIINPLMEEGNKSLNVAIPISMYMGIKNQAHVERMKLSEYVRKVFSRELAEKKMEADDRK